MFRWLSNLFAKKPKFVSLEDKVVVHIHGQKFEAPVTLDDGSTISDVMKDLDKWSRNNWRRVPDMVRQDCINELRVKIPKDLATKFKVDYLNGRAIGSFDSYFHFGTGMAIRNVLRNQLLDNELPAVMYGSEEAHNWDDYYLGCLQEYIEQELTVT